MPSRVSFPFIGDRRERPSTAEATESRQANAAYTIAPPETTHHTIGPTAEDFIYTSKRLELNLGPRLWPMHLPSYGRQGTVSGTVEIKDVKNVKSVTVRVRTAF